MKLLKTIGVVLLTLALSGCPEEKPSNVQVIQGNPGSSPESVTKFPRFTVNIVGTFFDGLAYDNERGIYIIKDGLTGKEYFGISGVGISELGSHTTGKQTIPDER